MIWDIAKGQAPLKKLDIKSLVGYDISWSGNGEYLFVTAIGGITVAVDAKTLNIVD